MPAVYGVIPKSVYPDPVATRFLVFAACHLDLERVGSGLQSCLLVNHGLRFGRGSVGVDARNRASVDVDAGDSGRSVAIADPADRRPGERNGRARAWRRRPNGAAATA